MKTRCIILFLAAVCTVSVGCHPLRFMSRPQESPLGHQMSELNSSLRGREITLDKFESSKHNILQAAGQPAAMNAR